MRGSAVDVDVKSGRVAELSAAQVRRPWCGVREASQRRLRSQSFKLNHAVMCHIPTRAYRFYSPAHRQAARSMLSC